MMRKDSEVKTENSPTMRKDSGKSKKVPLEECIPMPFDVHYSYIIHLMSGMPLENAAVMAYCKYISFQMMSNSLKYIDESHVIPRKEIEDIVNKSKKVVDNMVIYNGVLSAEVHPVLYRKVKTFSFVVPKGWDHVDILTRMNPETTIIEGVNFADLENFTRVLPPRIALDRYFFGKSFTKTSREWYNDKATKHGIDLSSKLMKTVVANMFAHFHEEFFRCALKYHGMPVGDVVEYANVLLTHKKYEQCHWNYLDIGLVFNLTLDFVGNSEIGKALPHSYVTGFVQFIADFILLKDTKLSVENISSDTLILFLFIDQYIAKYGKNMDLGLLKELEDRNVSQSVRVVVATLNWILGNTVPMLNLKEYSN